MYVFGTDLAALVAKMNLELAKLCRWLAENGLAINIAKTKYMILGKKHLLATLPLDQEIPLKINNINLTRVSSLTYLGVILDEGLTLKPYIRSVLNKMARKMYVLVRVAKHLPKDTRTLLYKTLMAPHKEYCALCFNSAIT